MSDPRTVERTDPDEVFTALSNDTRVAVLQALWEADGHEASFSDLRETVGMRDSGQFNYHLEKLVGRFVRKRDEGYELTQAGKRINGAIQAGAYTIDAALEPIALEESCPTCGGERTLYYDDETVRVECESCPVQAAFGVPPSVFATCEREAIPTVAGRYLQTVFQRLTNGFCSFCDGRVRPTVGALADSDGVSLEELPDEVAENAETIPFVRYHCRRCGATPRGGLELALLQHPAVAGFYYDHGVDVYERSLWAIVGFHGDHQRIRSRDPFRAAVTYSVEGDDLTVVVDDALAVVDVEA